MSREEEVDDVDGKESSSGRLDRLSIAADGPVTAGRRIPLSELARIASEFQATLERLAYSMTVGQSKTGRFPQEITDAVRLDFIGFREGSAVLDLERPPGEVLDDLLTRSFRALVLGIGELAEDNESLPQYFTPGIVGGLVRLCGGINSKNIISVTFRSADETPFFVLDAAARKSFHNAQKKSPQMQVSMVGRLHMGDFNPVSLSCRIDTNATSISCDFDFELKDRVVDLLEQLVVVGGVAEMQPDGTTVRVLHLETLSRVETSVTKSLDELALEQNVSPISGIDDLRGGDLEEFDDDFDTFYEAIRSAR